jgi:hypothetical protein
MEAPLPDPLESFLSSFGEDSLSSRRVSFGGAEEIDWSKKKLHEIKDELKRRGLKVTGNKANLVARLNGFELPVTPAKKRKEAEGGAETPKTKKPKDKELAAFPVEDEATKLKPLKSSLLQYVRRVAEMVNANWHDGYEEQGEELEKYTQSLTVPLQAVYNLAVAHGVGYARCHEVMLLIADSWENMNAIPMRGGIKDSTPVDIKLLTTENTSLEFTSMQEILEQMWMRVALGAARSLKVDDELLKKIIKDAKDYSVHVLPESEEDEPQLEKHLREGTERLSRVFKENLWQSLPTVKKTYKMRPAVDRRFSRR